MRWFLFSLFVLGLAIAILGWFFDRAANFNFVLKKLAPDYVHGIDALDILAGNNKMALTSEHPGFIVLLSHWPDKPLGSSVAFISRSVAFTQFGPRVKNDFQLILRDNKQNEIIPRWSEAEARIMLENELNRKLFISGTIIFFIGIILSFLSGLFEFLKDKS